MTMRPRRARRGVSIIELTISLAVLAIAMLGMAQMQIVAVRTNRFSRSMAQASAFAHDSAEMMSLWDYADPRLAPLASVTSFADPQVQSRYAGGRDATIPATVRPQFGEPADTNASIPAALGAYDGARADVDGDGRLDFLRYWSVFALDADGDGVENGKLVVVLVRWREPGVGLREVVATTFRANPGLYTR